jgi:hypothetical protein
VRTSGDRLPRENDLPTRQLTRDSAPMVQPRRTVAKRIALEV